MAAGEGEGLVEGSDADTTLYQGAKIIDVALEGVFKLDSTRQSWNFLKSTRGMCLTPDVSASAVHLEAMVEVRSFFKGWVCRDEPSPQSDWVQVFRE